MIAVESVIVTTLAVGYGLALLLRVLRRSRPGLEIGTPFAVGYVLRLLVIAGVAATGIGAQIRDAPDELTWLADAHQIAAQPWSSGEWLPWNHQSYLHAILFAAQLKALGSSVGALRVAQVGISLAGALLLAVVVYDLAGGRASRLAAWLLVLEPASLLFNDLLLKEPLMELAAGLVALGAARVWRRLDLTGVAIMCGGGAIALGTRWYVGWILLSCAVIVVLHASLRGLGHGRLRAVALIYGVAGVIVVATPVILAATSHKSLQENLQPLHQAESTLAGGAGTTGSHLALEQINYSSRGAIVENLPQGVGDLLLHPYPWQLANRSQTLGAFGSLFALAVLFLLIRYALRCRGEALRRAGPLLYPLLFTTVAYALATGNAGQGFRYRTHLVTLAVAAMVVLREAALARRESTDERPAQAGNAQRSLIASAHIGLRSPGSSVAGMLPPGA